MVRADRPEDVRNVCIPQALLSTGREHDVVQRYDAGHDASEPLNRQPSYAMLLHRGERLLNVVVGRARMHGGLHHLADRHVAREAIPSRERDEEIAVRHDTDQDAFLDNGKDSAVAVEHERGGAPEIRCRCAGAHLSRHEIADCHGASYPFAGSSMVTFRAAFSGCAGSGVLTSRTPSLNVALTSSSFTPCGSGTAAFTLAFARERQMAVGNLDADVFLLHPGEIDNG